MKTFHIAVACRDASGMATMPVFTVTATTEEYNHGIHYKKAKALAEDARYEEPFICFDDTEHAAILAAVHALDLTPQVIAIDMSDGLVHRMRGDAGSIKVICYDRDDTDEFSDAVDDYPVGENGQLIRCWAQVEITEIDPGLKKARD